MYQACRLLEVPASTVELLVVTALLQQVLVFQQQAVKSMWDPTSAHMRREDSAQHVMISCGWDTNVVSMGWDHQ